MKLQIDGNAAIERIMKAYGFRFRNDLCRQAGISSSTLSTWLGRNKLPGELLIQCALDTGVAIDWLVTGDGDASVITSKKSATHLDDVIDVQVFVLTEGVLASRPKIMFDKVLLPSDQASTFAVMDGNNIYLMDHAFDELDDGTWLISIDGKHSIRQLSLIPGKRVKVSGAVPFECSLSEIEVKARLTGTYTKA